MRAHVSSVVRVLVASAALASSAGGCDSSTPPPAPSAERTAMSNVTGTVTCRQRIALPSDAVVRVRLEDVSRADAPATTIGEATVEAGDRRMPIPFSIAYDPGRIDERRTYVLRATVTSGDRLLLASTTAHPVLTHGAGAVSTITVEPVAATPPGLEDVAWTLVEIAGRPVAAGPTGAMPGIRFDSATRSFAGNATINSIAGSYVLDERAIALEPGPMTMMAGPPALMEQERNFVAALRGASAWRIERDRLELVGEDGTVLVFGRADAP